MLNDTSDDPLVLFSNITTEFARSVNPSGIYGIWLVVEPEESMNKKGAYTNSKGRYVYINTGNNTVLFETIH